jgi:hypothetical protein
MKLKYKNVVILLLWVYAVVELDPEKNEGIDNKYGDEYSE